MKLILLAFLTLIPTTLLANPEMRPLFNGKDLAGWKGEGYVVEDGAIVSTPQGKNLQTEATFSNYILEFEFLLTPGANNGLGIHYPGHGDGAYTGMESQILDDSAEKYKDLKDYQFHGSLYTLQAAKRGALKPVGEWNKQRVTVTGPVILIELNGQIILRANLDDLAKRHPKHEGVKRRSGTIAFLGHGDKVSFRNIMIGEFIPAANEDGVRAAGYEPMFDGESLDGWKHQPGETYNWAAINRMIKHNGKAGATKDLWTEKSYKDFSMVFDWRWAELGEPKNQPVILPDGNQKKDEAGNHVTATVAELDSGLFLRGMPKAQVNLWNWTVGSGEVYGYRTDNAQSPEVRAAVTPKAKADAPPGEWNRMMIQLVGDKLKVVLNGVTVIDGATLPGVAEEGPIGLQHHGQAIDFANLWIKEL